MSSFISTNELRHVNFGREIIGYKTIPPGNDDSFLLPLKIVGSVAFGFQVHNSIYIDDDFLWYVVTVRLCG